MSDRLCAEIRIGGNIPSSLVGELCRVIRDEGVGLEWGENGFSPENANDLTKALDDGGMLCLKDAEASWGEFAELERFCVKHGIAFERETEGKYEFDPETSSFRPGMSEALVEVTNEAKERVVTEDDVRKLEKLVKDKKNALALKLIGSWFPQRPELEPFRIVEG